MSGEDRSWMDNRRNPGRRGVRPQFLEGLEYFVEFARAHPQCMRDDTIRYPYKKCKNRKFLSVGCVKKHLMEVGFVDDCKVGVLVKSVRLFVLKTSNVRIIIIVVEIVTARITSDIQGDNSTNDSTWDSTHTLRK